MKGFDTDSPRIEKQKLSESVPYLQEINRAVREKEHVFRCKKGSFPFIKTYLISPVFNRGITAKPFHTDGRCIACKRCEHTCPVHNITVTDKPIWGKKCTSCLACIHVCPVKTIQYGKQTQHKGRYLHPGFRKMNKLSFKLNKKGITYASHPFFIYKSTLFQFSQSFFDPAKSFYQIFIRSSIGQTKVTGSTESVARNRSHMSFLQQIHSQIGIIGDRSFPIALTEIITYFRKQIKSSLRVIDTETRNILR